MANRITIQVDSKGVVDFDFEIDNSMNMLIAIVDAMNNNENLANILQGACETRLIIRSAQEKAIEGKLDKDQIDMFNETKDSKDD